MLCNTKIIHKNSLAFPHLLILTSSVNVFFRRHKTLHIKIGSKFLDEYPPVKFTHTLKISKHGFRKFVSFSA